MPKFHAPAEQPLDDVSLEIGGKERQVTFDMLAILKAESVTGVNLLTASVDDLSASNARALLYASLLKDDPDVSIDEVTSWIKPKNVAIIVTAVRAAWFGVLPEEHASAEVADPAA